MRIGQKVKIKVIEMPDDMYNPRSLVGNIISLDGNMNPIIVLWPNGIRNSYVEKNLEIIYD